MDVTLQLNITSAADCMHIDDVFQLVYEMTSVESGLHMMEIVR